MLQIKKYSLKVLFSIILITNASFVQSQWISFDSASENKTVSSDVIVSNDQETIIEFTLPGMEVKELQRGNELFQVLRLPNFLTTMETGKPQLPVLSEIIGIPDLSNVKVSIIESEEVTFNGYNIYPSQELRLENESKPFVIDKHFYEQDIYYPSTDVQISQPHIWRDVRMVVLKVFPIKYNPFTKILKISRRIVVRLEYFGISDVNIFTTQRKAIKTEWNKLYKNTIINYDFLNFAKENKSLQKLTSESDYDYLIIVVDGYYDNI